jgi:hypothetical protein
MTIYTSVKTYTLFAMETNIMVNLLALVIHIFDILGLNLSPESGNLD